MLEIITLVAALLALVLGSLGFGAGAWACVQVLGWKRSTHRIEYRPVTDTTVEHDIPQPVLDQMPQKPQPQTLEQYMRELKEQGSYLLDSEED